MAVGTPVSKIVETIERVEVIQGQLRKIVEALDRLDSRVVALEKEAGGKGP